MSSYQETLNYIFNLRGGEIDLRLHRVERALSLFGHPERRYRTLHIAGTNGKGSTAAMLHSILSAQGYRVGLYISPHVVSFNERIRVGDEEIADGEVIELAELLKTRLAEEGIWLTFFEFITVMAFLYFARREVEVAVVEVGLGGRLDATNLVLPDVCVITTISKDHEAYLGRDLLSIAREKGGIIKSGVPLVCGSLLQDVKEVLKGMADAKGAASYFLGEDFSFALKEDGRFDYRGLKWNFTDLSLALLGRYQRSNAALVLAALEVIERSFSVGETAVRQGLAKVFWPGRLEVILRRPTVILDGAHNGEGIKALVGEIGNLLGGKKVKLFFGAMADKDWPLMLRELSTVASEVILTRAPMERSADPNQMAQALATDMPRTISMDPVGGIRHLLDRVNPDDVVLVTGSLYLLGEVRPVLCAMAPRAQLAESAV
jgi:dihydrofolate synthase/folylpolyglutamate synthase